MSMEFANRICPNCKNPNYMVLLGDFSKAYKYKCMNCNRYFNDIDFKEPTEPVWKTEWMNKKVDMVEVVRCKDCKYSSKHSCNDVFGNQLYICQRSSLENDELLSGDWFCAGGDRGEDR